MNLSENRIIQECFIWHHNTYPDKRGLFFKIKNDGLKNLRTAISDKATGLIPGVADTCLIHKGKAVFLEFKTEIGKQSPAQKEWEQKIIYNGGFYCIIKSLDEFKNLINIIYG